MSYLHPSLVTPEHGHYYIVFTEVVPTPQVVVWRKEMGEPGKGAFCTKTVGKRTTRFDVLDSKVLLIAELPLPTQKQLNAAEDVHNKQGKEPGPVSHVASGEQQ